MYSKSLFIVLFLLFFINIINGTCNILSLSGGGSFGAIEIGILKNIHKNWNIVNYDLITGVSVGGLNAAFLSFNKDIKDSIIKLENIYENLKNDDIYKLNYHFNIFNINDISLYDTAPLKKTITNILKEYEKSYVEVIIGSTNLNSGAFEMFRLSEYSKIDIIDLLMTTSAIPFAFPPRTFNNSLYVDGGLISNSIINGIDSLINCNYYNITYLSAHNEIGIDNNIKNIFHYTKRVMELFYNDFDDQIVEIRNLACNKKNNIFLNITYCYPNYVGLSNYSILDFTNGKKLIEIGNNNNICENINLC